MVLLAVLILCLAGAVAAATWRAVLLSSDTANARALQNAAVCPPASTDRTECRLDIPVIVNRTWSEGVGRLQFTSYYVALSGPAPADGTIQLTSKYWLPTGPDDSAVALVWRGKVVGLLGSTGDQFDTVRAPRLAADHDLNWLVAATLCALAFLAVTLSLFTRLKRSIWRYPITFSSVLTAGSFTLGAAVGSEPSTSLHIGLYIGAGFSAFFVIITALALRKQYVDNLLW